MPPISPVNNLYIYIYNYNYKETSQLYNILLNNRFAISSVMPPLPGLYCLVSIIAIKLIIFAIAAKKK